MFFPCVQLFTLYTNCKNEYQYSHNWKKKSFLNDKFQYTHFVLSELSGFYQLIVFASNVMHLISFNDLWFHMPQWQLGENEPTVLLCLSRFAFVLACILSPQLLTQMFLCLCIIAVDKSCVV